MTDGMLRGMETLGEEASKPRRLSGSAWKERKDTWGRRDGGECTRRWRDMQAQGTGERRAAPVGKAVRRKAAEIT